MGSTKGNIGISRVLNTNARRNLTGLVIPTAQIQNLQPRKVMSLPQSHRDLTAEPVLKLGSPGLPSWLSW